MDSARVADVVAHLSCASRVLSVGRLAKVKNP